MRVPLARTILLGLLFALGPAGAFAQAPWYTVKSPWGDFTAEMPGRPAYSTSSIRAVNGDMLLMHQHVYQTQDTAYVIQHAEYPAGIDVSTPRNNIQSGLDNAAKRMTNGRFDSVRWVAMGGRPAADAIGRSKGFVIRSFSVMNGRRIYTRTYSGPPGSANTQAVDRFIASFRFTR